MVAFANQKCFLLSVIDLFTVKINKNYSTLVYELHSLKMVHLIFYSILS